MKLLIVSGLSGSGKSTALHLLEDLGYYCVDNLPAGLLSAFATQMIEGQQRFYENAAVGIDARNRPEDLQEFPTILDKLVESGLTSEVIFLDADDNILLKRFSETRRKHPLTRNDIALVDAIDKERKLLDPISSRADLYIDTSHTNLHQLRDLIKERVGRRSNRSMSLLFESFGFKHGMPGDADFVFDMRCLPNPYWDIQLRSYTGLDKPVMDFLDGQQLVEEMFTHLRDFLDAWIPRFEAANRSYLTVAIGCTGGQHRSIYMVQRLAAHFRRVFGEVIVRHRELR